MILPNNGKVIVFDDKVEDVSGLLSILSKERIPYLYYHDEYGDDLPEKPVENVRLVFLDLELVTNNPNPRNIIGPIAQRLKQTLMPHSLYILIYWSTKEDKYRAELEKEFENGLSDFKPLKILSLNKAKAKEDGLEYIRTELTKEIKQFSALNAFMLWESSVNNAAGSITNQICSIFSKDGKWDTNMSGMLHQLAKGQAGHDAIKGLDRFQLLELAVDVINTNLIESVEKNFQAVSRTIHLEEIRQAGSGLSDEERMKLHTKIHLLSSDAGFKHFYPGNLYIMELNGLGREIIQRNIKEEPAKTLKKETTRLICVDLTPACDYAQEKNYSRMAYGILTPKEILRKHLRDGDYRYDGCPVMKFDDYSFILIDFRCVRSFTNEEFLFKFPDAPKYRLRNNLLLDITAQLANHVNRPGIITI
ncbi:hypothetical protein [Mucilaginibacter gotjawali]|uniref:Uncharacterized protein n=2 Tax=Mucilaginibacter gotjawali TaxID=1550579 RepID=A0A110AZD3_9SPHI|nr:hypothetical protein [Mucilaginibacter gotjawali]MBB3054270.1 hypothetical protein [Mucilaginibacter gotjawali]BAU51896.1 hypothetical protein MgSA37_00045 [Mucilaginibacter gotjawali]